MNKPYPGEKLYIAWNYVGVIVLTFMFMIWHPLLVSGVNSETAGISDSVTIEVVRGETIYEFLFTDPIFLVGLLFLIIVVAFVSYSLLKGGFK